MKIAVEGCAHGELDKIYETIQYIEKKENTKVDLLLICGDFQAVRYESDMKCMAVPKKFQKMNSFYKYYNGEKVTPVLTIIIGGNHEASNYMQELPYGGWLAPNIYYLGYASIVQFGGVRIGGLSGIYKGQDFYRGHYEHPPYTEETKRSVYHVRNLEFFRMKQIKRHVDIMLSHDWPRGIHKYGDLRDLLRKKKFLENDIETNTLGSPPAEELLHLLQPTYWFSAHLHVKFSAIVPHRTESGEFKSKTKFLSLDKCLPRRDFLQILDIPHRKPLKLQLDPEWLAVLKSTNHLLNLHRSNCYMPGPGTDERYDFTATDEDIQNIIDDFGGDLTIPENFVQSENVSDIHINEQTTLLCDMLDLTDPNRVLNNMDSSFNSNSNISMQNITDTVHSECSSSEEDNVHTSYLKNVSEKSPDPTSPQDHIPQAEVNNESTIETTELLESINSSGSSSNTSKRSNTSLVSPGENKKFKRRNLNIYYDSKDSIS
ncbi:lariat debranching enzyme-like isoform X1 [Octopus sinensis]|uniref:Lariat debranching enzyme-like isoform X1 n=1 Tax=Octopus sinensis TaxID=2607531 RepID=A0A6P7U4R1_9MOLL|nr:lariat debranching enzyme-like isoform X1 [Octopus sinensis]XP_029655921.1 lariat debranching enzyme-like isoform X1 [Octopus sinensis]XP_036371236.1 lariat debranching enzyme-like isoform X1 [Octopus sinensis]